MLVCVRKRLEITFVFFKYYTSGVLQIAFLTFWASKQVTMKGSGPQITHTHNHTPICSHGSIVISVSENGSSSKKVKASPEDKLS